MRRNRNPQIMLVGMQNGRMFGKQFGGSFEDLNVCLPCSSSHLTSLARTLTL